MVTNNNRIVEIHFEVKIKHASDAQTHDLLSTGGSTKKFPFQEVHLYRPRQQPLW